MNKHGGLGPGPMNPGSIVSAGVALYRARFKLYLRLAFFAVLWAIVPVYGWAKTFMYAGLITRLAYHDIIDKSETLPDAYRQVKPKLWSFLTSAVLVGIILGFAYICLTIFAVIVGALLITTLIELFSFFMPISAAEILSTILSFLFILAFNVFSMLWVFSRLMLPDVALAIEPTRNIFACLDRSSSLANKSSLRVQFVTFALFLVSSPIFSLIWTIITAVVSVSAFRDAAPSDTFFTFLGLFFLLLILLGSLLLMPLWQTVRSVLYYDLRCRREGIDLLDPAA